MSSPPRKRRDPPAISLSKLASLLCPNDDPCDDDNSWKCHCSACCPLHPASTVSSMLMKSVLSVKKSLLPSSDQEDECCCVHGRYKCELGRSTSSEGLSIISNLEDSDICCTHGHQSCSVNRAVDKTPASIESNAYENITGLLNLSQAPHRTKKKMDPRYTYGDETLPARSVRKKPTLASINSLNCIHDTPSSGFLQSGRHKSNEDSMMVFENETPSGHKKREKKVEKLKRTRKIVEKGVNTKGFSGRSQPIQRKHYENLDNCLTTNLPAPKCSCVQANTAKNAGAPAADNKGYDNFFFLAEKNNAEVPPPRHQSLRLNSVAPHPIPNEALDNSIWGKFMSNAINNRDLMTPLTSPRDQFGKKTTKGAGFTQRGLLSKLVALEAPDFSELNAVELLVIGQLVFALILIISSIAMSVTGSSYSSAMFYSGVLTVVQLLPTILSWLAGGAHVKFAFSLSSQICAYSNAFWSLASFLMDSGNTGRVFLLLVITTVQFGSFCFLQYHEYAKSWLCKQDRAPDKIRTK